MSHTLFISDLHLCESRPRINQLFFDFLKRTAPQAEALYILGDLFEYWIGDDDIDDGLNGQVVKALAALAGSGTKLFFMHGNRDFLVGDHFAEKASLALLPDPTLIDLHGTRTLLMHGDTLCTDDIDYQSFRAQVRGVEWQRGFLAKPLHERRSEVEMLRQRSEEAKRSKSRKVMDANTDAVQRTLREFNFPQLIHGHTHRPACHIHSFDGTTCRRWVLQDWYNDGGYLRCSDKSIAAERLLPAFSQ
jgi:UDP-2,3-diacylglucosamine hydrolase